MPHSIQISDELWEAAGGSPSLMRDLIWQGLSRRETKTPTETREALDQRPRFGTPFTAGRQTWCPRCGREINPGDQAVMMDYVDPRTGRTKGDAFDFDCARERGWQAPA